MNIDNVNITKAEMIQAISEHEVFKGLPEKSLSRLQNIVDIKVVRKNETLFEIGDQPNHIYFLLFGSLTLHFPDRTSQKLEEGELIGEIGVLNGDFRLGALKANEDSMLISISGTRIYNPEIISPETSLTITRRLSKRVTNYLRSVQQTSTRELILKGENDHIEFKSTLRWNIKAEKKDKNITHAVLKTIAAFLNSEGGILIVGVSDSGDILGLESDQFENEDKMMLFLTNTIKSQLGPLFLENINFNLELLDEKMILRIDVRAGSTPCYIAKEKLEHLYIRTGPSTTDLRISKVYDYIKFRFPEIKNTN